MKAMVEVAELRKAAQVAALFVGYRHGAASRHGKKKVPYEKGPIKIDVGAAGTMVSAVDFEGTTGVSIVIPHPVSAPHTAGECIINPDKLLKVLAPMPRKATATLAAHASKVSLAVGEGQFDLPAHGGETATLKPFVMTADAAVVRITAGELRDVISQAAWATPKNDHRRVLMGCNIKVDGAGMKVYATDGKKLAVVPHAIADTGTKAECTVPVKALLKALAYFRGAEEIKAIVQPYGVSIDGAGCHVRVAAIDGKFPDCEGVTPKTFTHEIPIHTASLVGLLRNAAAVAHGSNRAVQLAFKGGKLTVSAGTPEDGRFSATMACGGAGDAFTVDFNVDLLLEVLAQIVNATFTLRFKGSFAPCLFGEETAPGKIVLAMPLKDVK